MATGDIILFNKFKELSEHKPNSQELQTARFFGKKPPTNEDEIVIRGAIESAVKSHPGLSQTKLRDMVKDQGRVAMK